MPEFFKKYLLPGFVFQSIVIGGGYGTGREIVEFFLQHRPIPGLLGMLLATLLWSLVLAVCFELARVGKHYDYRTFVGYLLGKGWIGFEIVYILSLIIAVAVVGSATGELVFEGFGASRLLGIAIATLLIGVLAFNGSRLIEKVFSVWSITLYAFYLILIFLVGISFGGEILRNATRLEPDTAWIIGGVKYAAYNLGALPAMLFSLRYIETRREAVFSGLLAGPIAIIPGILVLTTLLSDYPAILSAALPINQLLGNLGIPLFQLAFQIILFGTFIETGAGMIHGFNERIAGTYREKGREMPKYLRLGIAVGILLTSVYLAGSIGLVNLIAKGYGLITWGYWVFFVFPVLTLGVWKILKTDSKTDPR
jgi:uncharacterized membrane protein YkvI